jgi:tRNA pseudouridine55 synthase
MNAGILNVLKPPGMTSHDVVDFMRRLLPKRTKVGHAGTLDPAAAGVLVVCVGETTRLTAYLMEGDKSYRAEACLGIATDTLDAEGKTVAERDASGLTEQDVREALAGLVGPQLMQPPMYSAARVGGKRLYDLARQGREVEREPRPVTVHEASLVCFEPGPRASVLADIRCSKGTYVRVLCAQMGERLGVGAHMSFLVRTAVGPQALRDSVTLEELRDAATRGALQDLSVAVEVALSHLPDLRLDGRALAAFSRGATGACATGLRGPVRVHGPDGALIGVGEVVAEDGKPSLQPSKVLCR